MNLNATSTLGDVMFAQLQHGHSDILHLRIITTIYLTILTTVKFTLPSTNSYDLDFHPEYHVHRDRRY